MGKDSCNSVNFSYVVQGLTLFLLILLSFGCLYLFLQLHSIRQEVSYMKLKSSSADLPPLPTGGELEPVRYKRSDLGCGGDIVLSVDRPSVQLTSPNFPENYPNNANCEWIVRPTYPPPLAYLSPYGPILHIEVNGPVNVQNSTACIKDRILVQADGAEGPELEKICGEHGQVWSTVSHRGPLFITFKSDGDVTGSGFNITVRFTELRSFVQPDLSKTTLTGIAHKTYVRWGARTCQDGTILYDGYVLGYGQTIACVPYPVELSPNDTTLTKGMPLMSVKYDDDNMMDRVYNRDVAGKLVRCSRCHVSKTEVFTVVGWKGCHSDEWTTVYSGYLMTMKTGKSLATSEAICVDKAPDQFIKMGPSGDGPHLSMFHTGYGFWYPQKPVPCAVCAK